MSETANTCRWDGTRTGHYEVWYLTVNHRPSQTGYWIRYTLESPLHAPPYVQLWFAHFDAREPGRNFGIHRTLPIEALATEQAPFSVTMGESRLTHQGAHGRLAGAGHEATWDLAWPAASTIHHHLPGLMYRGGGLGETTVLSPNLDVPVSGTITVDGRTFALHDEPGGQTHLWGRKHAHAWAWGHCNTFTNRPGATLEALSVQLMRGGRMLPRLTLFTLYLDGQAYRLNGFRHTLLTGGDHGIGYFAFHGRTARLRIEGAFSCRPEDMVVAPYVDPDGEPSWCANTEVADLHVTIYERSGLGRWRERERLLAPRGGHFEVAGRQPPAEVPTAHILVDGTPPASSSA